MQCIRSRECVGEHTKLQLISDSSKSELHTPGTAWTSLVRTKKGMFRSIIWEQFSLFPVATHLAHCPYLIWGKVLPQVHLHILAKAGSSMRVSGRFAEHIANSFYDPLLLWGAHSFMTFEEPFYLYIVGEVSLTSRIKDVIILSIYPRQRLFPLCPCQYLFPKNAREKQATVANKDRLQLLT